MMLLFAVEAQQLCAEAEEFIAKAARKTLMKLTPDEDDEEEEEGDSTV